MDLVKKAAYLKGLMDGLKIDDSTDKGKVLCAMYDLLEDMVDTISDMDDDLDQVYDELDAIDEDMDDIEEVLFGDDDDEEEDDDDDDDIYNEEEVEYELTCPECGAVTTVDEDTLFNEQVCCGSCGHEFDIEFVTEDEFEAEKEAEEAAEAEKAAEEVKPEK